jgi:predicted nucleotidyltransferase
MNDGVIRRACEAIGDIAARHDLAIERIVGFGSYGRGDDEASDLDVVVVSSDWAEEADRYARPTPLLLEWSREDPPVPAVVPVAPAGFERRSSPTSPLLPRPGRRSDVGVDRREIGRGSYGSLEDPALRMVEHLAQGRLRDA